jgi:hypothetical protein
MSPPEQTFNALMAFLKAGTWDDSRRILNAHPELLNVGPGLIDMMLKDPTLVSMTYPGRTRSEAEALLRKHKTVLARCKQIGVTRAFAEMGGQRTQAQARQSRSGFAWFGAIVAVAVLVGGIVVGINLSGGSDTPGGVVASAVNQYSIEVTWTDNSKDVTGYNIDNGCPIGTCGGHGINLAKTTGEVTSTVFVVTPGTYQCFRVQAITSNGFSQWSGYGCTSTPSFVISGTQAWTPTQVILESGDLLEIQAAGQLSAGSSSQEDPAGDPSCTPAVNDAATASSFPARHLPCLSLIARVGSGRPFEVGDSAAVITGHGRLYLGVNANNFSNSSGSWTVNIKIGGAPPSP